MNSIHSFRNVLHDRNKGAPRFVRWLFVICAVAVSFCLTPARGALVSATLAWAPPQTNLDGSPATDLAGHKVYIGTESGVYDRVYDAGDQSSLTISDLQVGVIYYLAVSAYDSAMVEGPLSAELVWRHQDADLDGISDQWELAYFGSKTGALAHIDSDGDGLTNLEEYVLGTDPHVPNDAPAWLAEPVPGGIRIRLHLPPATSSLYYPGLTRFAAIEESAFVAMTWTDWEAIPGYESVVCEGQEIVVTPVADASVTMYRARIWLAPTL